MNLRKSGRPMVKDGSKLELNNEKKKAFHVMFVSPLSSNQDKWLFVNRGRHRIATVKISSFYNK